jgi:hypothetical protein
MASTQEGGGVVQANGKVTAFAVICSGVVTEGSDIVSFRDEANNRTPVVLFQHIDRAKCDRMKKRLATRISKIDKFEGEGLVTTTPILGVVPILLDAPIKREKKEGEEAGKPGRKKGSAK